MARDDRIAPESKRMNARPEPLLPEHFRPRNESKPVAWLHIGNHRFIGFLQRIWKDHDNERIYRVEINPRAEIIYVPSSPPTSDKDAWFGKDDEIQILNRDSDMQPFAIVNHRPIAQNRSPETIIIRFGEDGMLEISKRKKDIASVTSLLGNGCDDSTD